MRNEERLRAAISDDGEYSPDHLKAWADQFEREYGYKNPAVSIWLRQVAKALADTACGLEMQQLVDWLQERRQAELCPGCDVDDEAEYCWGLHPYGAVLEHMAELGWKPTDDQP